MKILDCTLRDGGYYTNWDFPEGLVSAYIENIQKLPVEYVEVGYRGNPEKGYMGEYYFLPTKTLQKIRASLPKQKISVMLNAKEWTEQEANLKDNLRICKKYVDVIRIACDPDKIDESLSVAKIAYECDFRVYLNIMHSHKLKDEPAILEEISKSQDAFHGIYLVDSYGSLEPEDIAPLFATLKKLFKDKETGFHGHDNLGLAFANSLAAKKEGADIIDATITGMGRGAGNLNLEVLMAYLGIRENWDIDYTALSALVDLLTPLKEELKWGTNLTYMISGASQTPQKTVVDLLSKRRYSTNTIVKTVTQSDIIEKEVSKRKDAPFKSKAHETIVIIGGGNTVPHSAPYIKQFIDANAAAVIHASTRNMEHFTDLSCPRYLCVAGDEILKLGDTKALQKENFTLLGPKNSKIPVYIPAQKEVTMEWVETDDFSPSSLDNPLSIALSAARGMNADHVYLVGFDGYNDANKEKDDVELFVTNQIILDKASKALNLTSLTPTTYKNITVRSLYSMVS